MARPRGPSSATLAAGQSFYWKRINSESWHAYRRRDSWAEIASWANSNFAQTVITSVRRPPGRGPWTRSQVRRAANLFAQHNQLPPP
ncbi:MAG: hypothetical protein OXM88_02645 [bacterium]|nr:hypothetical protein [bacterium]